jgi:regulator of protease activity HflC (stomatin/prohibitin superfamily)
MNPLVWVFAVVLTVVGATVGSVRRVNEGNEALVERLGKYQRKLTPGLNFGILPIIDEVVAEATVREQILDIEPNEVITKDNVTLVVDAVIFWRIMDLYRAFYEIDNVKEGLKNLVITTLRSEVGLMNLQETYSSRTEINRALLENLDDATEAWGVKVTRVEIQDIKIPNPKLQEAIEDERAAKSRKQAAISKAEGERQAAIARAEGEKQASIQSAEAIAESVKRIADALPAGASTQQILRYLVAQRYVDANVQLGESPNSKIVFMNPRDLTEGLADLISQEPESNGGRNPNSGNGSNTQGKS